MCRCWTGLPPENVGARMDRLDIWLFLAKCENAMDDGKPGDAWEHATAAARRIRQCQRESIDMTCEVEELAAVLSGWPSPAV
jgi:hypothetical protein